MQTLINDLLSFFPRLAPREDSWFPYRPTLFSTAVLKNLKRGIEESRAIITRDPLPIVLADELPA